MENRREIMLRRAARSMRAHALVLGCVAAIASPLSAQTPQIANMAVPAKSFQMVIYPVAQQKGYMKEEDLDERVIFVAPTTIALE